MRAVVAESVSGMALTFDDLQAVDSLYGVVSIDDF